MIGREVPKARELKPEDVLDPSIVRELEQNGFVAAMGQR
jgi:hypothetical protein